MFRVKTAALFALPVALTVVLWVLAVPSAGVIDEASARLVGLSLLGIALLSTVLVFCAAAKTPTATPRRAPVAAGRAGNEVRRGFVSANTATPRHPQRAVAPQPSDVIGLRRRPPEPRLGTSKPAGPVTMVRRPAPVTVAPVVMPPTIATLKQRLEDRAEKLWPRRVG